MDTQNTSYKGDFSKIGFNLVDIWGPQMDDESQMQIGLVNVPYVPFGKQLQTQEFAQVDTKVTKKVVSKKPNYQQTRGQPQTASGFNEEKTVKKVIVGRQVKKQKLEKRKYARQFQINFKKQVRILPHFKFLLDMDKIMSEKTKIKNVQLQELFRTGIVKKYNTDLDYINTKRVVQLQNLIEYKSQDNIIASEDPLLWELWYSQYIQQSEQQKLYDEDQEKKAQLKQQRKEARQKGQEVPPSSDSEDEEEENDNFDNDSIDSNKQTKTKKGKVGSVEAPKYEGLVVVSDTVLLAILTLQYSVFPFELKVQKDENAIIICAYEKDNLSWLGQQIQNENWTTQKHYLDQEIISQQCLEATQIANTFQKQAVEGQEELEYGYTYEKDSLHPRVQEVLEDEKEDEPVLTNKIGQSEDYQNTGFRYIKLNIDDKIHITTRTQVDAWLPYKRGFLDEEFDQEERDQDFVVVKTLNEHDLGVTEWRHKFQHQMGDLISTIQMHNLSLMNKWLFQMYLAGAQKLKIAYVSRNVKYPNDPKKHTVLYTETFTYEELKKQLKVNPDDAQSWKMLKHLINYIQQLENGTYLLLKQPYSQSLKIYNIPEGDFQYDENDLLEEENNDDDDDEGEDQK